MSTPETIADLAPRLRRKEISPVELTRSCLERIEKLLSEASDAGADVRRQGYSVSVPVARPLARRARIPPLAPA